MKVFHKTEVYFKRWLPLAVFTDADADADAVLNG